MVSPWWTPYGPATLTPPMRMTISSSEMESCLLTHSIECSVSLAMSAFISSCWWYGDGMSPDVLDTVDGRGTVLGTPRPNVSATQRADPIRPATWPEFESQTGV